MLLVTFLVAMTGNKKGRVYFVCKLGDRQRSHGGAWLTSCPTEAASHIVPRVRRKGVRNALIQPCPPFLRSLRFQPAA